MLVICYMIIGKAVLLDNFAKFNFKFDDEEHNFLKIGKNSLEITKCKQTIKLFLHRQNHHLVHLQGNFHKMKLVTRVGRIILQETSD